MRDDKQLPTVETVVFGNFGFPERTESSGQIIRTREVSAAIASHKKVSKNTEINYGRRKIRPIIDVFSQLRRDKEIFVFPGKRMLVLFGTILAMAQILKIVNARIHLVAIGGWLPRIVTKYWGKIAIEAFSSVSAQLPSMTAAINRPERQYWLPNFRKFDTSGIPPKESSDIIRLIHISRLIKEKGVFDSIETARILAESGVAVRLVVYGPDEFNSERDRTKFFAEVAEAEDFVTYCGDLPHQQVIPTIAGQDFVLFPSTYSGEGFPGVIVESLIAATPVLALDVGYISEISEHYEFGYVVRAPFPQAAADIIMRHRLGAVPAALGPHKLSNHSPGWAWFEEICFPSTLRPKMS